MSSQVPMPRPIFVVSDGTGETAEKVVRAALRQFSGHIVHVRTFSNVTGLETLRSMFREAKQHQALVVTTLVAQDMRQSAQQMAYAMNLQCCDLLGPVLSTLSIFLGLNPVGVPNLAHQADARYYARIAAVEFTVRADDGKNPRLLKDADIVLVGVSRTSKTPLSTFLAHKGYRVANQPLVLNHPVPEEVFAVDQGRVFALTIEPSALQTIRRSRLVSMRMPQRTNYGDMDYILAELEYAADLYRGNPVWPVINVTNKAIEETSAIILGTLTERGYNTPLE